jgi:hypothetical protein
MLHDDCVARSYIPPGFAYQLWLDKVKDNRTARAKIRQAQASEASIRLLRRGPPNIPTSVSGTVIVKSERVVTGGRSMVMLMETSEGKIADLRKQKDAVLYLSGEYDEDDMSYYAVLIKRTMELDISAAASVVQKQDGQNAVTAQEKEEARQAWLASKHDSINEQLGQLKNSKQQVRHGPVSGQGGV